MTAKRFEPWTVLSSREVYANAPYLTVSVERVRLPDGREIADFHRLTMPDYALVWPELPDGRVIVLRQYKHGVGAVSLTFPAGTFDPGEDPLACAERELREETGYEAASWRSLGRYVTHANSFGHAGHLFVAAGCRKVAEPQSGDLEETELLLITRRELLDAARRGEFKLMSQIALLALVTHPELGGTAGAGR